MPKDSKNVVQEWLQELSWREQTVLFTALRGPDGLPKENPGKSLCRFLRSCILRDATPGQGTFMRLDPGKEEKFVDKFLSDTDQFPHHFLLHLLHAAEILGYKHPDKELRSFWSDFYVRGCKDFHMHPETEAQMDERLKDLVD